MKPAVFFIYYWQFDGKAFAFYLVADAAGKKVTEQLSGESLLERGIPLPVTPSFETWKQAVYSRRRCSRCWERLGGTLEELATHEESNHLRKFRRAG